MRFVLEIQLGNAEMETPAQIADALYAVANKLSELGGEREAANVSGYIRDANGNTVGNYATSQTDY